MGRKPVMLLLSVALVMLGSLSTQAAAGPLPSEGGRSPAPGAAAASGAEPRDLAFGAAAAQSSTAYGATADRAVDLTHDGAFSGSSVTHTAEEHQPWWQADLGASKDLEKVVVWNRTDCCAERLSDFWVLASDSPITADGLDEARNAPGVRAQHVTALDGPSATVDLAGSARYIRVQLAGTGYLSLAEVQAFGQEMIAPSAEAQSWVKQNKFGMFLHYGMGTYTDSQWADPNTPAARFDPPQVDPDQWAKGMKSAGMTFGVLTVKHHDGFALWPTAQSAYSVAASPYQGARGTCCASTSTRCTRTV